MEERGTASVQASCTASGRLQGAPDPQPAASPGHRACGFGAQCPWRLGGAGLCPHGTAALRPELALRFHAEGLQPLALGQQAVEPLHQRHSLVDAHLDAAQDGRHFIDFLDLLCVFGVPLLALLHEAKESFYGHIHLFDSFNQSILIKSDSLCTLMEVILIPEAELQHLLGIQFLQFGICWGSLATQQSFRRSLIT